MWDCWINTVTFKIFLHLYSCSWLCILFLNLQLLCLEFCCFSLLQGTYFCKQFSHYKSLSLFDDIKTDEDTLECLLNFFDDTLPDTIDPFDFASMGAFLSLSASLIQPWLFFLNCSMLASISSNQSSSLINASSSASKIQQCQTDQIHCLLPKSLYLLNIFSTKSVRISTLYYYMLLKLMSKGALIFHAVYPTDLYIPTILLQFKQSVYKYLHQNFTMLTKIIRT